MSEEGNWAEKEFRNADLGDKRLNRRLIHVAGELAARPSLSIPAAMQGWDEAQAAYRLFANEQTTYRKVLEPHLDRTLHRIAKEKVVLIAQDTTQLDFTPKRKKMKDAGPLEWEERVGFLCHCSIAVTPGRLHLGLVGSEIWARDVEEMGKGKKCKQRDFEEKESRRWRDGYRTARGVAEACPATQVINVGDRESDIYEYLVEATDPDRPPNAHFLVRAAQNRCLTELRNKEDRRNYVKMLERLREAAPVGETIIQVPARAQRKAREAVLEIRVGSLELKAPENRRGRLPNIRLTVIWAKEKDPPKDESEPIEWRLLTDLEATTLEEALVLLNYYTCRWEIEIYFRVLKSGCEVEELQFETLDHFAPCLMLYQIAAWRVLNLMMLGRECPEISCEVLLTAAEWKSAWRIKKRTAPPKTPPSLGEMVKLIASLGGHLGRSCDGPPGPQTMWIGLQRVQDFALAYIAFGPNAPPAAESCA